MGKAAAERTEGTLGIATGEPKKAPVRRSPKAAQEKAPEQAPASSDAGDTSVQGEGTAGDTTKQVMKVDGFEFDVLPIPARGGTPKPETYPFSKLPPSKLVDGEIVGPSLFIPESENPQKHYTQARKVAPEGTLYHVRAGEKEGVKGTRIWKTIGVERGSRR